MTNTEIALWLMVGLWACGASVLIFHVSYVRPLVRSYEELLESYRDRLGEMEKEEFQFEPRVEAETVHRIQEDLKDK